MGDRRSQARSSNASKVGLGTRSQATSASSSAEPRVSRASTTAASGALAIATSRLVAARAAWHAATTGQGDSNASRRRSSVAAARSPAAMA